MNKADEIVEQGAERLDETAETLAARESVAVKPAQPLAEDADFFSKLKPSLVEDGLRPGTPAEQKPTHPTAAEPSAAGGDNKGRHPLAVIGAAAAAGLFLAKFLDWRSHAHPRS